MKRLILISLGLLLLAGCSAKDTVNSTDGVPIAFEKFGDGEITLVLVHGWCCDRTYWREQVPVLAEQFTVVTLDLAGHGDSGLGRSDYTMTSFGSDVAAVVSALDLKNVYLVGHSMSGQVVVEAARSLSGRIKGIIGIDTLREPYWNLTQEMVQGYLQPLQADFRGTTLQRIGAMFPSTADTALVGKVARDMASAPPEVGVSAMGNLLIHDIRPTLALLDVPIWCLDSNQTPINFNAWKFYQPGFTAVVIEGVGHFLFLEKPAEFNQELITLVERMEAHKK